MELNSPHVLLWCIVRRSSGGDGSTVRTPQTYLVRLLTAALLVVTMLFASPATASAGLWVSAHESTSAVRTGFVPTDHSSLRDRRAASGAVQEDGPGWGILVPLGSFVVVLIGALLARRVGRDDGASDDDH